MSERSQMVLDAFRPQWGWPPEYIRAADPADRWKLHVLRIGAGILVAIVLPFLGVRIQPLW